MDVVSDSLLTKWRHNTFTAFCRHLGEHSTPSRPNHAWNKELLSPAIKRLEVEWDALMNWMDSEIVELTQGIDKHSQAICRMLESKSANNELIIWIII
jgi:hypothetical protein